MKPITKEWIRFANDDLDVAKNILKKAHLTNMVAFHSHQTIEKCFKAVVEEYKLNVQRIHNLETLYASVKYIINFDIDNEVLKELNEVYISARYPSDLGLMPYGKPTKKDANRFFDFAQRVYHDVNAFLKKARDNQTKNSNKD